MRNRCPEEVTGRIKIEVEHYLDTFDSFRGKIYRHKDCLVVAIVNIGVDGPRYKGRDENWIDKCILVANSVALLDPGINDANGIVIGGESLGCSETGEIQIGADSIWVLLFSDSKVFAYNPLIGQSEAEEFIRSVDVSNTEWISS